MTRGVGLSMFTLLLFEQWEGVINTDEHSHLTQASMNQIRLTHTHTHTKSLESLMIHFISYSVTLTLLH